MISCRLLVGYITRLDRAILFLYTLHIFIDASLEFSPEFSVKFSLKYSPDTSYTPRTSYLPLTHILTHLTPHTHLTTHLPTHYILHPSLYYHSKIYQICYVIIDLFYVYTYLGKSLLL